MINHARSLLLNVRPDPTYRIAGEEFIPAQFVPQEIPSYLEDIRKQLFGHRPDRLMLNYRGPQLMQLLHATELTQFVQQLDGRITYERRLSSLFDYDFDRLRVQQTAGPTTSVYLRGDYAPAGDVTGSCRHEWDVTQLTGLDIEVQRLTFPYERNVQLLDAGDGTSSPVALIGTGLGFAFRTAAISGDGDGDDSDSGVVGTEYSGESNASDGSDDSADSDNPGVVASEYSGEDILAGCDPQPQGDAYVSPPSGDPCSPLAWTVSVDIRPRLDLGQIAANLSQSGEPSTDRLFGLGDPYGSAEPFKTFRNLWYTHKELPYRLGGLLLALIYQLERVRTRE